MSYLLMAAHVRDLGCRVQGLGSITSANGCPFEGFRV